MISRNTQMVNTGLVCFLFVVSVILTAMTNKNTDSSSTAKSCDIRPQKGDVSSVATTIDTNWTGTNIFPITQNCLNIRPYILPDIVFDKTTSPGCSIQFTVSPGSIANSIAISSWSVHNGEVQYCKPGTYPLYTSNMLQTAVASLTISKSAAVASGSTYTTTVAENHLQQTYSISRPEASYAVTLTFTKNNNGDNTIGTIQNSGLDTLINPIFPTITARKCVEMRRALADLLDSNTGCTVNQSQFCSCVTSFTSHIRDDNTIISSSLSDFQNGIIQCSNSARHVDKAAACTDTRIIYVFLAFSLLVLAGAVLEVVKPYLTFMDMWGAILVWVLIFIFTVVFAFMTNVTIGGIVVGALVLIAVVGLYWGFIVITVDIRSNKIGLYTLMGYFFTGVFLLMMFTLLTRGSSDMDVILIATGKCIAVTVVYGTLVAYYTAVDLEAPVLRSEEVSRYESETDEEYKTKQNIISSYNIAPLHDSKRILILLAILISSDHLFIPYATPIGFETHWLLPTIFVWAMLAPMLHGGFEDHFKIEDKAKPEKQITKTGTLIQTTVPTIMLFYLCYYQLQAYMFVVRPFNTVEQQVFRYT